MSTPKVPPEIARKIAAMGKPAPAAPGTPPRQPAAAPARPAGSGGLMRNVAAVGWVLALLAGAAAVGQYYMAEEQKSTALAAQAAEYEAKLQKLTADSAAALKKVQDDATAQLTSVQTELDYQKLPEIPLKTVFRPGQVLYIESELEEPFACKVRLQRPGTAQALEVDFQIKARTFQDLGALQNWVFARGDKVEFYKPGYKPRALTVP